MNCYYNKKQDDNVIVLHEEFEFNDQYDPQSNNKFKTFNDLNSERMDKILKDFLNHLPD